MKKINIKSLKEKINIKKLFIGAIVLLLILAVGVFSINFYVKSNTKKSIITTQSASSLNNIDCIIVLGCQVREDGTASSMLSDRISKAVELYKAGVAKKILMSGDHGRTNYNEVKTMKEYAINMGVPSSDIFMDHAGFSTYETMYRAKEIFCVKNAVIVTQTYHLYRALYIANSFDINCYGVPCESLRYGGEEMREIREILARNKDFFNAIFKPKPTFLGDEIPITTNGNITNDY